MNRIIIATFSFIFFIGETLAKPLYVGYIERAPHIYANADGSVRGLLGKQLQDILKRSNVDAEFMRIYPQDIDNFINRTDLDAFIATKTLMNDPQNYVFSKEPLFTLNFYVYHLSTTPNITGINDLKNASVILPISLDSFRGPLKEHIQDKTNNVLVSFEESNLEQQIVLLKKQRADYAVSYFGPDNIAMMFSKRTNRDNISTSPLFKLPMFFVLRRSVSSAGNIMDRINTAHNAPN